LPSAQNGQRGMVERLFEDPKDSRMGNVEFELRELLVHCTVHVFHGRTHPPEMSASRREILKFAFSKG
jgi:hypothetical protein